MSYDTTLLYIQEVNELNNCIIVTWMTPIFVTSLENKGHSNSKINFIEKSV